MIEFEVSGVISATPEVVYAAWLNSEEHSAMTESPTAVSAVIGEEFEAWDGYISGKNIELDFPRRILQRWRTSEFEESDGDSFLEILFEAQGDKTRVVIRHSSIPDHGMLYKQGWIDAYYTPMEAYFLERSAQGS